MKRTSAANGRFGVSLTGVPVFGLSSVRVPVPWIFKMATRASRLKMVEGSVPGPGRKRWIVLLGNRGPNTSRALNPPGIGMGAGLQEWMEFASADVLCCALALRGMVAPSANPLAVAMICRREKVRPRLKGMV